MSARRQIIAALSEDSLGGIATLHDVTHAEQLVDSHRTEVLAETDARLEGERMQHGHRALFSDGIEHARQAVKQMAGEREEKAPAPAPPATPALDGYLPGWLTSIGLAGSETERALYGAYEQAMAEVRQLRGEKATPEGATATPELTVYRASHDSIVMGLYTTAAAAREHCETLMRRDSPDTNLDWIEDEEDDIAELTAWLGGEECVTGYVVTALAVASAYDEEADE